MQNKNQSLINSTILLVDDTPENLQLLAEVLSAEGASIKAAPGGHQALQALETLKPDLILLDVMMPEINGYEVCSLMKANPAWAEIPVIFITAKAAEDDIKLGFDAGGVDYITKPFKVSELLARVKIHLTLKRNKEMLEKDQEEKKNLLHILCHDLTNPLSQVITIIDLLQNEPDLFKKFADKLLVSMKNGLEIIGLVREMLAIENNKLTLKLSEYNLKSIVEEALNILALKLENKKINISINIPEQITVYVEKVSFINSILNNLLSNAIKFSQPEGTVEIIAESKDNNTIIKIRDYGIGIPETLIKDLFDIKKSTTRVGTRGEPGTGFGMPLTKKFLEYNNGNISIQSPVTVDNQKISGTEVCITLESSGIS